MSTIRAAASKLVRAINERVAQPVLKVALAIRHKRSSKWPSVRESHIRREWWCQCCGAVEKLEVHHVLPVHVAPDKELEPGNLITLCETEERCHLRRGHAGSWRRFNPAIRLEAKFPKPTPVNQPL